MKIINLIQPCALFCMVLFLLTVQTGCGHTTKAQNDSVTSTGQQLLDLEKAHSEGVISDKEYEKLKKAIVKKND